MKRKLKKNNGATVLTATETPNAENSATIMRKEDMFMNKKRIMSLISILVPVAIAAIGEFSDQLDARKQEEEMEDINKRIEALEAKQNEEV